MTSTPKNRPVPANGAAASAPDATTVPAATTPAATPAPCNPPLFDLGALYATPGALRLLKAAAADGRELLHRHCHGDWGDCYEEDAETNNAALKMGGRLFSVYQLPAALPPGKEVHEDKVPRIWIITEADRSVTTLLLPEDY